MEENGQQKERVGAFREAQLQKTAFLPKNNNEAKLSGAVPCVAVAPGRHGGAVVFRANSAYLCSLYSIQ